MPQTGQIFIGICGTVVALDRNTGAEVWRCSLKGADFVNVVVEGRDLYATTKGELFCLEPATGRIRWQNPLKGLGRGLITIATTGSQQTVVMGERQRQEDEDAAARRRAMM